MAQNTGKINIKTEGLILQSDTTRKDTIREDTTIISQDTSSAQSDTSVSIKEEPGELDLEKIDSLFRANERKEKEFQKQKLAKQKTESATIKKTTKKDLDTTSTLYELFGVTKMPIKDRLEKDPSTVNFLYNIPSYASDSLKEKGKVMESYHTEQKEETSEINALEESTPPSADWIVYLLGGIFLLLGWTRLFYRKYTDMLLKSIVFFNYARNLYSEKSSLTIRASMLLNSAFFLTLGLFSYQLMIHFDIQFLPSVLPIVKMIVFSGFFVAWYIWNAIFTTFIGVVFRRRQSFEEYFHNINLYRKVQGIVLFPIVVVIQFIILEMKEPFIIAGIILFGIIYLMHIIRGLQIFHKNNFSIFYLILYLCALEFLPLIVLFKGIIRNI